MKPIHPKTLYRWLALAPLAVLLSSCNDGLSDIERNSSLREAMELWQQSGVTSYRYTFTRRCFCPRERTGPVRIEVRNGQPVSVTPTEGVTTITRSAFDAYDTVEELFAAIAAASERRPFLMAARYDENLGYPVEMGVDYRPNVADDEDGFLVSGFERIQ